jgi:cytoplasmic iron level regulating protein YaaA (DUF328/UPF0246 family)
MMTVISPSKTLDFAPHPYENHSLPRLLEHSQKLIDILCQFSPEDISKLMKISDKLGELNWQRYHDFEKPFTLNNAKQALLAFKGDVYSGIDSDHYDNNDFSFAQQHLRILSGLYGLLKPLDLIQPYRLEMGIRLQNEQGHNLYEFWDTKITELLNQDCADNENPMIINLASNEYFKAIKPKLLKYPVLQISFKENKNGEFKTIGIHAKRARGLMTDYIIKHRLNEAEGLKAFNRENYCFNEILSNAKEWVFTR